MIIYKIPDVCKFLERIVSFIASQIVHASRQGEFQTISETSEDTCTSREM